MPRIKIGESRRYSPDDWQRHVLEQLRDGRLLPMVSNRLHDDLVLGGHRQLVQAYAEHHKFPFAASLTLPAVAQYNATMMNLAGSEDTIRKEYLVFVKSRLLDQAEAANADGTLTVLIKEEDEQFDDRDFSVMAANLGLPRLGGPNQNPLLMLAEFDIPVYLTTSFHGFLEQALRTAGKQPRSMFCRWHSRLVQEDPLAQGYQPSVLEPLVYHLHGIDTCPESLVLSEDDHLAFLVNVSRDHGLIPPRLRQFISNSSLMLLGYDLMAWEFRTLFCGLIKDRPYRLQSVCVLQLQTSQEKQAYFGRYMEDVDFKVFWGDVGEYLRQLHAGLRRRA